MSPSEHPRVGTAAAPVPEATRVLVVRSSTKTYHVESARGGPLCGSTSELDTVTLSTARADGRRPCVACRRALEGSRRRYLDVAAELHRVAAAFDHPRAPILYAPSTSTVGPNCYHIESVGGVPLCNSTGAHGAEYNRESRLIAAADGARLCETCRVKSENGGRSRAELAASGGA